MKIAAAQEVVNWEAAAAAAAARWAEEAGSAGNVAVVGSGGNLTSFLRKPGAFFHSIDIAIDNAFTAAGFGLPTAAWPQALQARSAAVRQGLALRRARSASAAACRCGTKDA